MGGTDGLFDWTFQTGNIIPPSDAKYAVLNLMYGYWDGVTGSNAQIWFDDVSFFSVANLLTVGPGNSFFYAPTTPYQGTVYFKIATVDWTGNVSAYSSQINAIAGVGPIV